MSSEDDGEKPLPPPPPAQPEGDGKRKSSRFRRRGTALFKKAFGSKKKKVDNDFLDVDDDGLREMREEEARKMEARPSMLRNVMEEEKGDGPRSASEGR